MTWKTMSAGEVCDIMDFWAGAAWPLSRDAVKGIASQQFGWFIEAEDDTPYLTDTVSEFAITDVSMIESTGRVMHVSFRTTDAIPGVTSESIEFLEDAFTRVMREGETRWGKPTMREHHGVVSASWAAERRSRILFARLPNSVSARFETPQGAKATRRLDNFIAEEVLHPRGLYGFLGDCEIELLSSSSAGTFGVPVEYVTAWRAEVTEGTEEVVGDNPTKAGLIHVPRSAVRDLARWRWTVVFEGRPYAVDQVDGGLFLISTPDRHVVQRSAEWEGSFYDGWARWIDPAGLEVTAQRHPQ